MHQACAWCGPYRSELRRNTRTLQQQWLLQLVKNAKRKHWHHLWVALEHFRSAHILLVILTPWPRNNSHKRPFSRIGTSRKRCKTFSLVIRRSQVFQDYMLDGATVFSRGKQSQPVGTRSMTHTRKCVHQPLDAP